MSGTNPTTPAAPAPQEPWSFSKEFQTNVGDALSNFNNTLAAAKADNVVGSGEVVGIRQSFNSVISVVSDATQNFYGTNSARFTASTQQGVLQAENKLRNAQSELVQGKYNPAEEIGKLLSTAFSSGAQAEPTYSVPATIPASPASSATGTAAGTGAPPLGSDAASQQIDQLYSQQQSATTVAGKSSALGEMIAVMQNSLAGGPPPAAAAPPATTAPLPVPTAPLPPAAPGAAAKLSSEGLRVTDALRQLVPSESSAAPSILDGLANISKALYNQALPPPATTAPGGNIGQVPGGAAPASPQEFGKAILAALQNVLAQLAPMLPDNAKTRNVLDDVASFLMDLKAYIAPPSYQPMSGNAASPAIKALA